MPYETNPDLTNGLKYDAIKKCPRCEAQPMKHGWPGGDPEQGPAIMTCGSCGFQVEPCSFCELAFHPNKLKGDSEHEHDSFGNGIPAVDKENDELDDCQCCCCTGDCSIEDEESHTDDP